MAKQYRLILIIAAALLITALAICLADLNRMTIRASSAAAVLPIAMPQAAMPDAPPITTLIFSGDVMLSRNVGQKMIDYGDWTWPLKAIAAQLASADLTVINLESPFTISNNHTVKSGSFSFNADPRAAAALRLAGIDVAGLANNHMLNQGAKGITDTKRILSESGIETIGAGRNAAEAHAPLIKTIHGVRFGFLSYAYPEDGSVAGSSTPGIASMSIGQMRSDIAALKSQSDQIIVIMHAGTEYTATPNKQQVAFAHAAVEAGADLVIGHHPHWVQQTEIYLGKPILYSLGNLVFDQMWSTETTEGALAKITWSSSTLQTIEMLPITIRDYGQAQIATSSPTADRIFKRMNLPSGRLDF